MKNILVFNHSSFPLSSTFIYRQVQVASAENKVHLVTLEKSNESKFPLTDVNTWILKYYYGPWDRILFYIIKKFHRYPLKFSTVAIRKLLSFIKENNIDLIHIHYGTWAVHFMPLLMMVKIPVIVSFHGYDASQALNRQNFYKERLPALFNRASKIIIVSEHMRSSLGLAGWDRKVYLLPYGIDPSVFTPRTKKPPDSEIKILHSGRLTQKKGVPDLIKVFADLSREYKNVSLHILGDGVEKEECERLITSLELHSVYFYGSQPLPQVIELMQECHVFVLNSRTAENGDMEGFPNSILEAMSTQLAVVSTYHAGIPMAITDQFNGLLVPEKDNHSLYLALSSLIVNRNLRLKLGIEARKTILSKFTFEQMKSKLLSVYASL